MVIDLVDQLICNAISARASDIHLEPTPTGLRVRWRIDGVLYDSQFVEHRLMAQLLSRVKVLSKLNIAEKRIPQDGHFQIQFNNEKIDLRISTFPSIYGEKIVIRILDKSVQTIELDQLGFCNTMLSEFRELINKSSGFLLVTGPTGSGKTTTLYATLLELNRADSNIMTLEDPVEYHVDGIVQGHIHSDTGFTFAKGIRALLRQDPDIALIGEIRDRESAHIAIEAALTGHLIFSTLHTSDAPGAIIRLMDMGIEPFLINASLTGVLSQRLARKICAHCKESYTPTEAEQKLLEQFGSSANLLFKGRGCNDCNGLGNKGRIGIFELLRMTSNLRSCIVSHPIFDLICEQAKRDGMKRMHSDGILKIENGIISLNEFLRILS